ncbi:ChaN family lipoprotein [Photobacterium japonica]|uniref:ChaN family lipoprotein n=1 Tax=Photobacterium japonica TaxID=2910235 RepID=UPI003D0E536D
MRTSVLLLCAGITCGLVGCSASPTPIKATATKTTPTPQSQPLPSTLYDYTIHPPSSSQHAEVKTETKSQVQAQYWDVTTLSHAVKDADIVLVGEWHGHPAVHLLQAQLLAALYHSDPNITVSMEQFSRDKQHVINQYLAGEIGEETLIRHGKAWPNYRSDYRPLIEFAKQHQLDVIAANVPRSIVRCVGKMGPDYLDRLPPIERTWAAQRLTLERDAYRDAFETLMAPGANGAHSRTQTNNHLFAAQTTWDDTMAESMVNHLAQFPSRQILHIAGRFHVTQGLGLASRIAARNPALSVVMITPVTTETPLPDGAPDYTFTVQALPVRYINEKEMQQAMGQRVHPTSINACRDK